MGPKNMIIVVGMLELVIKHFNVLKEMLLIAMRVVGNWVNVEDVTLILVMMMFIL